MIAAAYSRAAGADAHARSLVERLGGAGDVEVHAGAAVAASWGASRALGVAHVGVPASPLDSALALGRASGPFAAVTPTAAGLLLARGTAGGEPMYYARAGGAVIASSRLAPVVEVAGAPLDPVAVGELVFTGVLPPGATPYVGVRRLRAGELLEVTPDGALARAMIPADLRELEGDDATLAGALWEELTAAVRRATAGASRVAVLVSGGLDSAAVLAAATHVARGRVFAVHVAIDGPNDDRPHAEALFAALGVPVVRVDAADLARHALASMSIDGAPYVLSSGPLDVGLLARAREAGADVALSGVGGDELFGGDLRTHALELFAHPIRAVVDAYRFVEPSRAPGRRHLVDYLVRPLVKPLAPRALRERVARRALHYARPWDVGPAPRSFERAVAEVAEGTPIPRDARARYLAYALDDGLADVADWRGMAATCAGLRRVDVLFDDALVRFACAAPPRALRAGRLHRGLLRAALAGRIPDGVRLRVDKAILEPGFLAAADRVRPELERLAGLPTLPRFAAHPTPEDVQRALAAALSTRNPYLWSPVWHTLAVEAWLSRVAR